MKRGSSWSCQLLPVFDFFACPDSLSDTDRAPVQAAIDRVKQTRDGTDVNAIRQALNNLQSAAHAMAQHVGRAGGAGPGPAGSDGQGRTGGGKEDVQDAEFEVKS